MQYLLLIHDDEAQWGTMPEDERNAVYAEYGQYTEELQTRGLLVGANQLQPSGTATVVHVEDGKTLTTDGPFVAVKEALGGYFVYEADDLDAAIEVAARVPAARMGGAVEVRPIVEWG